MLHDVIVIGGSYAGMAAALQLLRARRKVLVVDAGVRRNRFASESHGFLGQDGVDPAEIARTAREQLTAYPTLTWLEGTATDAKRRGDGFAVTTADGEFYRGKRLILATGVSDALPPLDGLAERWGSSIFHCPYCHGYELNEGRIGVIATSPDVLHHVVLFTEWGDVTLLLNGAFEPDANARAELAARGVTIEAGPVASIEGHADVRLQDGRVLPFAGLFTATRNAPSTPLAETLGCELETTPFGTQIRTDETKQTTVRGAFACGDVARAPHSVSLAVGDGAIAGVHVHRSLVF
ncbi:MULTISPECIES: NAD(P)/FAD-dependent oxidoreductase [Bradyrhizobium]|uniref:NAD(P)/FAD-dependent oxidoreductase n=1 Tax=Bradyrhizobium elkanii TaxID=29448 RepID=UPI0003FBB4CF|nr:NAD(P)/FAD-dependent oxidoreductase [Bradyrhizobium elkanii]